MTIEVIRDNEFVNGQEELIEDILAYMEENTDYEDALQYYLDVKREQMEANPYSIIEESIHTCTDMAFPVVIRDIQNLKSAPNPVYGKEATFRCSGITVDAVPESLDDDMEIVSGDVTEFRFTVTEESIIWLAEKLETELKYIVDYDRITLIGD